MLFTIYLVLLACFLNTGKLLTTNSTHMALKYVFTRTVSPNRKSREIESTYNLRINQHRIKRKQNLHFEQIFQKIRKTHRN
jgi:hypothetical protein